MGVGMCDRRGEKMMGSTSVGDTGRGSGEEVRGELLWVWV